MGWWGWVPGPLAQANVGGAVGAEGGGGERGLGVELALVDGGVGRWASRGGAGHGMGRPFRALGWWGWVPGPLAQANVGGAVGAGEGGRARPRGGVGVG
jgi:hypothetical protein